MLENKACDRPSVTARSGWPGQFVSAVFRPRPYITCIVSILSHSRSNGERAFTERTQRRGRESHP